jgi:hypothetical protein
LPSRDIVDLLTLRFECTEFAEEEHSAENRIFLKKVKKMIYPDAATEQLLVSNLSEEAASKPLENEKCRQWFRLPGTGSGDHSQMPSSIVDDFRLRGGRLEFGWTHK